MNAASKHFSVYYWLLASFATLLDSLLTNLLFSAAQPVNTTQLYGEHPRELHAEQLTEKLARPTHERILER